MNRKFEFNGAMSHYESSIFSNKLGTIIVLPSLERERERERERLIEL